MVNGAPAAGNGIDGTKDASANSGKDAARPAAADATIVDGVPALPADTIAASRGAKPNGPVPDRETPAGHADEQTSVDDWPAYSFGAPPSAPAAVGADAAESAIKPSGGDASRTAPSSMGPSSTGLSGTGLSSSGPSETGPLGTGSSGRPSSSVPPASADSPSVSTAAFAWEMPDLPPNSPSSPARTFLRSGTTGKGSAAPRAASPVSPDKTEAGMAAAGMAAAAEDPVTMRVSGQKGQKKGKSKRSARQAHLTVARVEPWSVM